MKTNKKGEKKKVLFFFFFLEKNLKKEKKKKKKKKEGSHIHLLLLFLGIFKLRPLFCSWSKKKKRWEKPVTGVA
ncbi:Protein CBG25477 [Caenorhabditis briggsae]|uniref:Protein CBG25477 n=1 Tax=Caenorhabditis briggsae TaxID=6238 RepID=B6IIV2_CAEBR|nr:Protein CBG25477 [Caenorhabditis briggsae]CAR99832.1 Protein CBG25477 [Caenorhabditis briggsae]